MNPDTSGGAPRRYPPDHWLRSDDPARAVRAYLEQQGKTYSRIKNAFVSELLGDLRDKAFLDCGCGPGLFLGHAAKAGASTVVGIDVEPAVLATARHFLASQGLAGSCRLLLADRRCAWPAAGWFDAVLLKDVLEHVADDQALLNAAARSLAPEGIVVLSTQNAFSLNFLIEGAVQRLWYGRRHWYGWDPTHLRFYTPAVLAKKLHAAGLRCVAWRAVYIVPHKWPVPRSAGSRFYRIEPLARLDGLLGRFFPWNRLGWNLIVKAVAAHRARS